MPVIDLKFDYAPNPKKIGQGGTSHAHGQIDFFSSYGLPANAYFQAMRQPIPRQPEDKKNSRASISSSVWLLLSSHTEKVCEISKSA